MSKHDLKLELKDVRVGYGERQVVKGVSLAVQEGHIVSFLGASGCGKSTLLKTIVGILRPSAGRIMISGRDVTTAHPALREIGLVFQDHSLFPHMSVAKNVEYGLRCRRVPAPERNVRVQKMLGLVRMQDYSDRSPRALSGGQAQRVAVARSLAISPQLLLMDEPFNSLDAKLRQSMRMEIYELIRQTGVTTVLVTHDQDEALQMSDVIAVMDQGVLLETGSPEMLYACPRYDFTADFIGGANILPGTVSNRGGGLELRLGDRHVFANTTDRPLQSNVERPAVERIVFGVRPQNVLCSDQGMGLDNEFQGRITAKHFQGSEVSITWDVPALGTTGLTSRVSTADALKWAPGDDGVIGWDSRSTMVLERWAASAGIDDSSGSAPPVTTAESATR